MTLCDGADLKTCDRCRHHVDRAENYCAAEQTTVRMRPMVRNGSCMDYVPVQHVNGTEGDLL